MSTQIEKEVRTVITYDQYLLIYDDLKKHYPDIKPFEQTNHYFDNARFELSDKHHMVRIRKKENGYELTFKMRTIDGDLEINQGLTDEEANHYLEKGSLPHGDIYNKVSLLGVNPEELKVATDLFTRRIEIEDEDHLFVLDLNRYNGMEDYNIEVESNISLKHAQEVVKRYCEQYQLTFSQDYYGKSRRAFKLAKQKLGLL